MRGLSDFAIFVALMLAAFALMWLPFSRDRDAYQICRGLGHGAAYCVFQLFGRD